jgi:UDP-N-acetylmuramate-alanine ligase
VTLEALAGRGCCPACAVVPRLDDVPGAVAALARPGDLVVLLGAGSIRPASG